jgi:putative peptide zinc metalloprotease protein
VADPRVLPSAQRALPLRARPELSVYRLEMAGTRMWGVKDPVSLRYYQLGDEEHFILGCLNGRTSLEEIRRRFAQAFSPKVISLPRLEHFLTSLHQQGLVLSDRPGQGEALGERRRRQQRQQLWSTLANPLAIRFRGVDPDRWLGWLYGYCRWMFSPLAVAAALVLMSLALATVLAHGELLWSSLADFPAFCTPRNLFWLAVVLAALKVLHELGHALSCKHFGAECHELGLMLLVFAPCLYCNVSDAWTLPRRWQRIAISAAGMYVECVVAAVCALLWYFSEPGWLHSIALNVMLVGSVSTLLFNGNPLLRYDGYYILSDLVAVPNLGQRASDALRTLAAWWFFGKPLAAAGRFGRRQVLLAGYAAGSSIYRWFVVLTFLWLIHLALKPLHMELLSGAIGLMFFGTLLGPLVMLAAELRRPTLRRRQPARRPMIRGGLTLAALAAVLLIPFPRSLRVPVTLDWSQARRVYVTVPGALQESVRPGTQVRAGQQLVRLENLDVSLDIDKLRGERNRQRLHRDNLRRQSIRDAQAAALLPTAEEALADVDERLRQRVADSQRLVLTAPSDGIVLPPPARVAGSSQTQLTPWAGSPLDEINRRAWLTSGTLVCLVGDPGRLEGTVVVDEAEIAAVRVGQRVRMWLEAFPDRTVGGTIAEVSELDLAVAPATLAVRGELSARVDAEGVARPRETSYQARVELDPFDEGNRPLVVDTAGRAKIEVEPSCLAQRLYRFLRRTFHIDLQQRLPGSQN